MFAKALLRCIAVAALSSGLVAGSQAATPAVAAPEARQPLGVGDTFRLTVLEDPKLDGTITVSDDGTAPIQYVDPVQVTGLSPVDAAKKIGEAFKAKNIFVDPHVTVTLIQGNSQRVTVSGEVNAPGRYVVDSRTTVTAILAMAGGAKATAASVVYIERNDASGKLQRLPVTLRGSKTGNSGSTTVVQPGDNVDVPEFERVWVTGEVKNSGIVRWEPDLTVQKAVTLAGGKTDLGSMKRIFVTRKDKNGKDKTDKIKPGDPVHPEDQIEVKVSLF